MNVFDELKAAVRPLIEAFEDDLLVHDKAMIEERPNCPFLHYTRACGTHMLPLPPIETYPAKGVSVPFLFGYADREHLLDSVRSLARSFANRATNHGERQRAVYHFDGKRLGQVTEEEARKIADSYTWSISRQWEETERKIRERRAAQYA